MARVLLQGDCEAGESTEVWDQSTAVGRGVRHQQLSSTVETLPTEVGRSEVMGRTVKAIKVKADRLWWEERKPAEKKRGKGWCDWNSKVVLNSFIFIFLLLSQLHGATLGYWGGAAALSWALADLGASPESCHVPPHSWPPYSHSIVTEKEWKWTFPDMIFLCKPCLELVTRTPWGT